MIPFNFFTISEHLDFLGVTLKATTTGTRKANGDLLQARVRDTVGPWRAGRFMPLNLRSHSVNCFVYSKLLYKCNVIDIRVADVKYFTSQAKQFIYADLLEKPEELALFRDVSEGGLGLNNIQCRASAALISTFLQTAINPTFTRNHFHNVLYRHYVLSEPGPAPSIPPYFRGNFFPNIRALTEVGDPSTMSLKEIYNYLLNEVLRGEAEGPGPPGGAGPGVPRPLLPLRCELASPAINWPRSWRLARQRGLGPQLSSFLIKMLWRILPVRARIHRILPRSAPSPHCLLCGQGAGEHPEVETLQHALLECPGNRGVSGLLLSLLRGYQPGLQGEQVLGLDLNMDHSMELPLVWVVGTTLFSIWKQRVKGEVSAALTRSELEARCRLLREGASPALINFTVLTDLALRAMFQP
jgi:hypothetical protein